MSTLHRLLDIGEKLDTIEDAKLKKLIEEARQLHALLRDPVFQTNLIYVIQVAA